MSASGQTEKTSLRANVSRFTADIGHLLMVLAWLAACLQTDLTLGVERQVWKTKGSTRTGDGC